MSQTFFRFPLKVQAIRSLLQVYTCMLSFNFVLGLNFIFHCFILTCTPGLANQASYQGSSQCYFQSEYCKSQDLKSVTSTTTLTCGAQKLKKCLRIIKASSNQSIKAIKQELEYSHSFQSFRQCSVVVPVQFDLVGI